MCQCSVNSHTKRDGNLGLAIAVRLHVFEIFSPQSYWSASRAVRWLSSLRADRPICLSANRLVAGRRDCTLCLSVARGLIDFFFTTNSAKLCFISELGSVGQPHLSKLPLECCSCKGQRWCWPPSCKRVFWHLIRHQHRFISCQTESNSIADFLCK